jgi:hypothetical protein
VAQLFSASDGSPLSRPEDVIRLLGQQELHWKERYSAYETAHSWFDAQDLPASVRATLESDPTYAGAKLRKAFFEKQTALDELGRGPSQTDVLAILEIGSGLAVVGIEGKVDESFGRYVFQWNDGSPSKATRLASLSKRLGIKTELASNLRYQLLHRTVATLLEAQMIGAGEAAMVVQSFSPDNLRAGFGDFQIFGAALGAPITDAGILSRPIVLDGIRLRLGWSVNHMRGATGG